MSPRVIINPTRTLFYCWLWDKWWRFQKLGGARGCFNRGCRGMFEPAGPHLRKTECRG